MLGQPAQQMPGLAIVLEARTFASALRIEAKAFAGREGLDEEHVPDIERDDVGDKNVNVVGGVNHLALSVDGVDGLNVVTAGAHDFGALELDAPGDGGRRGRASRRCECRCSDNRGHESRCYENRGRENRE